MGKIEVAMQKLEWVFVRSLEIQQYNNEALLKFQEINAEGNLRDFFFPHYIFYVHQHVIFLKILEPRIFEKKKLCKTIVVINAKSKKKKEWYEVFCICNLAALRAIFGHWLGFSFAHLMLLIAFYHHFSTQRLQEVF